MKTAISIPDDLYEKANIVANEMHCSRSKLFALAIRDYIEKIESHKILERLNNVYAEEEAGEDTSIRKAGKSYLSQKLMGEPY
jgi:predicted transcriptional regulator